MSLEKRRLLCEACGATKTAAIRDGAATGYVLCDDCAVRVIEERNSQ